MPDDALSKEPFRYQAGRDDYVQIFHHGRLATTLKGKAASRFLVKVERQDVRNQQLAMAKVTGQYKFGNEKGRSGGRK